MNRFYALSLFALAFSTTTLWAGEPVDEAKAAAKTVADFPTHAADLFPGMDGGVQLSPDEIKGRNSWMIWTAGNEAFWDYSARYALGVVDLLKLVDNRFLKREDRLAWSGIINEPGMQAPASAGPHGLWLDTPAAEPDSQPDPEVYGYSSGVIGLRLFPNPNFDKKAAKNWDAERYLSDESYSKRNDLVRPYRVGMACSFCHVAFHPLHPPANSAEAQWEHLSALIGNQYWKAGRVIAADRKPHDFAWQLMSAGRPGTIDTSIAATDGIHNPTAINSIWSVGARLGLAKAHEKETASQAAQASTTLVELGFPDDPERHVPKILMTGSDSIGALGALSRVWVNIGTYSEGWTQHFNLLVGVTAQSSFSVANAQKNSVYYQVTEKRCLNVAKYLAAAGNPTRLADAEWAAPDGAKRVGTEFIDPAAAARGAIVFAETCFTCHSSKQPEFFWADPSNFKKWRSDAAYLDWARSEVVKADFRDGNYLSTDLRYAVQDIGTHANRALGDNATAGRVWDNYASETYKQLPPLASHIVHHPYTGEEYEWTPPAKVGPGVYRPFSLTGIWATAPFLHNNALGRYPDGADPAQDQAPDISVPGRLAVFQDAIEKMLWPEKRAGLASIARTTVDSKTRLPYAAVSGILGNQIGFRLPFILRGMPWLVFLVGLAVAGLVFWPLRKRRRLRWLTILPLLLAIILSIVDYRLMSAGELAIGHIPKGTPVGLLGSLNGPNWGLQPDVRKHLLRALPDLLRVEKKQLDSLNHEDVPDLVGNLLKASKAPDFVEDRGHLFGANLEDADKRDLIEFLKTL